VYNQPTFHWHSGRAGYVADPALFVFKANPAMSPVRFIWTLGRR